MIEVKDEVGALSGSARQELTGSSTPFKTVVIFRNASSKAALDSDVGAVVTQPNMVVIGVDPAHHWTFTHFGTDTGVRSGDFQMVARAGNPDFKEGNLVEGVKAIISRAVAVSQRTNSTALVIQNPMTVIEKPVPVWPFVVGTLGAAFFGYLLWRSLKNKQERIDRAIRDKELASRNIREQAWADKISAATAADAVKKKTPQPVAKPRPTAREIIERTSKPAKQMQPPAPVPQFQPLPPVARRTAEQKQAAYAKAYGRREKTPAPVVVVQHDNSNDLATGILLGQAMSRPVEREVVVERRRERTPEPVRSSSYSDDSSSSSSSFSSSDSGGGGGDFGSSDSGGGGGSWD